MPSAAHLLLAMTDGGPVPGILWVWPFVAILGAIAVFPLLHRTHHWWESNQHKLLVSAALACATLTYYYFRGYGVIVHHAEHDEPAHGVVHAQEAPDAPATAAHARDELIAQTLPTEHEVGEPANDVHAELGQAETAPAQPHATASTPPGAAAAAGAARSTAGWPTVKAVLDHAIMQEFIPFFVLLFSLYVIAGGIVVRGDIRATPTANTVILGIGGVLASLIGTTGASMVLIRLLLKTNSERSRVVHTVVFFIFIVSNIGGTMLPIGDPPLFLGYLRGVPFFWTLNLWAHYLFMLGALLTVYWVWDSIAFRRETPKALQADRTHVEPIRIAGMVNIACLLGVVAAVAMLDPAKPVPGTNWHPFPYLREGIQLALVAASLALTPKLLREENQFNYVAINEVACLFVGIFITMQVPLEILNAKGAELGITKPWQFFWATGVLSSFLDNAPTYVVFFQTANVLTQNPAPGVISLLDGSLLQSSHLIAISCGAVFMGANSYIGNGPNFMVKSIAEQAGVKMPSFMGYMLYSSAVLVPLFVVLTLVFFRGV